MLRTSKRKGSLQVMLMALVVLVFGITAPGYGDDDHDDGEKHHGENHLGLLPTERLSGPALEGTLTLIQIDVDNTVVVFFGKCKGVDSDFFFTRNVSGFTVATTTARSLKGFRLPMAGPFGCLVIDQAVGEDLIVAHVKKRTFVNDGTTITDQVKLLHVVPRLHKDKDEDKDKDKDEDKGKDKDKDKDEDKDKDKDK